MVSVGAPSAYDKSLGAENFQDGIFFAFPQGEEGARKFFPFGLGHILASHVHVTDKWFRGMENGDFPPAQFYATDQGVENRFV